MCRYRGAAGKEKKKAKLLVTEKGQGKKKVGVAQEELFDPPDSEVPLVEEMKKRRLTIEVTQII